jgi:hypothetical protein
MYHSRSAKERQLKSAKNSVISRSESNRMTADELEVGYWHAYREFYRWGSIFKGAFKKNSWAARLRHLAYAGAWKKLEPLWDWAIRAQRVSRMLTLLEAVLAGVGGNGPEASDVRREVRGTHSSFSRDCS